MKILYGGRASGKTTFIIKTAHQISGQIVCFSDERCRQVLYHARQLKLAILPPITIRDIHKTTGKNEPVLIDDIDMCVQNLFRNRVYFMTSFEVPEPINKVRNFEHFEPMILGEWTTQEGENNGRQQRN